MVAVIQQHTQREKEGRRGKGREGKEAKGGKAEGSGCCNTVTYSTGEEALAVDGERTNNYAIIKLFWKLLAHY